MKPYYQDKWVTIYHGDCREILPQLDVKVDLVLTDPPYGIGFDGAWLSQMNLAHGKPPNKTDDLITGDDGQLDLSFLFGFARRAIFGHPYIYDRGATGWLIWDKQPGLDADRTMTSPVEIVSTTLWRGFRIIRCIWAGYLRDNGEHRFSHPTQKPQKVIDYIINKSEGLILDPFLGSGTTCYCAKKLLRRSIGIEIDEKYCEIARQRIKNIPTILI